jgi:hypothetical protein
MESLLYCIEYDKKTYFVIINRNIYMYENKKEKLRRWKRWNCLLPQKNLEHASACVEFM